MKLKNADGIRPMKDLVIVDIQPKEVSNEEVYIEEENDVFKVEMYEGLVRAVGPDATDPKHCPGLKTGDIAIFSQFAGNYISTDNDVLHKVIRGYDIMATTAELHTLNEDTLNPAADRLLVKVHSRDVDESGLFISENEQNPMLLDLNYGEVLKIGSEAVGRFKEGDLVAYDTYVGEAIRRRGSANEPELRVIRSDDILFVNEGS